MSELTYRRVSSGRSGRCGRLRGPLEEKGRPVVLEGVARSGANRCDEPVEEFAVPSGRRRDEPEERLVAQRFARGVDRLGKAVGPRGASSVASLRFRCASVSAADRPAAIRGTTALTDAMMRAAPIPLPETSATTSPTVPSARWKTS
jgi:hypothetical protein